MAFHEVGFRFSIAELPESCTEEEVCDALSNYNKDASIHGILVQLPLPQILNILSLEKDVDGFHPLNIGNLAIQGREPLFIPCTPKGCIYIVYAYSENPEIIAREADILVAATGVPNLVRGSWLKPGAVVLDVGINPIEDPESEHGYRLIGDVCFEEAVKTASTITPVPMTVSMFLLNTLEPAKRALGFTWFKAKELLKCFISSSLLETWR
ncbi:hypothetical protein K7X08_016075 [Anisodus acutangulus]|uniref:Tetrahydrofolate dehydrogenase/cyclohydrolase NAD(P)-binding domain-containing protein n=1 Tax=Anisodus acutangulus TaxID=402998 RepID=A0A9Q1LEE5_9SOLA|nr:hypothetical protein K7X08_016075 [Anisodus acutangulus]